MDTQLVLLLACGFIGGFALRPIFSASFSLLRRFDKVAPIVRFGLLLVALFVAAVGLALVMAGPLWLFGFLPLEGRRPMYFIGLAGGAGIFMLLRRRLGKPDSQVVSTGAQGLARVAHSEPVRRAAPKLKPMSKAAAYAKVTVIALLNLCVVSCSSVFAVHGDGTPGGMYWIVGIGAVFVAGFAVRAFSLIGRGEERDAVSLVSATLIYAFAFAAAALLIVGVLGELFKGR